MLQAWRFEPALKPWESHWTWTEKSPFFVEVHRVNFSLYSALFQGDSASKYGEFLQCTEMWDWLVWFTREGVFGKLNCDKESRWAKKYWRQGFSSFLVFLRAILSLSSLITRYSPKKKLVSKVCFWIENCIWVISCNMYYCNISCHNWTDILRRKHHCTEKKTLLCTSAEKGDFSLDAY